MQSASLFFSIILKSDIDLNPLLRKICIIAVAMSVTATVAKAASFEIALENDSIPDKNAAPAIIPIPAAYAPLAAANSADKYFELTAGTQIVLEGEAKHLIDKELREDWQGYLRSRMLLLSGQRFKFPFVVSRQKAGAYKRPAVVLILDKSNPGKNTDSVALHQIKGGYTLGVSPEQVTITAQDKQGFLYGLISLLQLAGHQDAANSSANGSKIPCWQIKDQPVYGWRGVMLDESRHFFGKAHVKKLLDWMAYYKLNYFHWHLTDEPGWRLQIKAYPKLTTIGAIGNKTDSAAPAKYYTQAEIREVVRYAKARGITVIPEIDMPGHATAANRAYPENSGGGEGKFADFTFNPGRDSTYSFLTRILRETRSLFDVDMVHLGGDEVSFGSGGWGKLPAVKALMAKEGLNDNKAVEAYFLRRMADSALQFNHKIMTWDEGVDAGLDPASTIIFWWRHDKMKSFDKAMADGYDIVLCPRIPLYFDFVQDSTHTVGRRWGGKFASLEQVFDFYPPAYTRHMKKNGHVLGMQANLWTETVHTDQRMDFMLFPRMAALAAAAWSKASVRQFGHFESVLKKELAFYKKDGIYYFNPFAPTVTPEPKK